MARLPAQLCCILVVFHQRSVVNMTAMTDRPEPPRARLCQVSPDVSQADLDTIAQQLGYVPGNLVRVAVRGMVLFVIAFCARNSVNDDKLA